MPRNREPAAPDPPGPEGPLLARRGVRGDAGHLRQVRSPLLMIAASAYDVVLSLHIMAVVVAFGVTFAYPIMFTVAARHEPRSIPVLHRIEYTLARVLINPVLVIVLIAGIYLASDGKHWKEFFVQWGLAAVIVIGAVLGAVLIPASKKAEALAT